MDDPRWAWPAWKFGLKKDDLFSSLHDQYNTFTFSLQDPEAFHADVYEVSHDADSADEFHRLMAERRQQRLRELHESLESLAVEIIANPELMDSEHWHYALQLFRTKSFDSLVRYFASYLPDGYLSRHTHRTSSADSVFSDASSVGTDNSTTASSVDVPASKYTAFLDGPVMTEEPQSLDEDAETGRDPRMEEPLSPPESETMPSQRSSPREADELESHAHSSAQPSRSASFSGPESEVFSSSFRRPIIHDDDESSQSDSIDTVDSYVSDCAESRSSLDSVDDKRQDLCVSSVDEEDDLLTAQFPEDAFDAFDNANRNLDVRDTTEEFDTPTPRPEGMPTSSYIDYKAVLCRRLTPPWHRYPLPPKPQRSALTPPGDTRRSPEEAHSKIQKPHPESMRRRPKGKV